MTDPRAEYADGGPRDDDLPDSFVARGGNFWKRMEFNAWLSSDGEWMAEVTVSIPVIGPLAKHESLPVEVEHVRHIYDTYEIVRESE